MPLREARNVPALRLDHEDIVVLKRELMRLLHSADAKRMIADIVHETMGEDRSGDPDDGLLDAEGAAEMLAMTPGAVRNAG